MADQQRGNLGIAQRVIEPIAPEQQTLTRLQRMGDDIHFELIKLGINNELEGQAMQDAGCIPGLRGCDLALSQHVVEQAMVTAQKLRLIQATRHLRCGLCQCRVG